jgi:hypothetical protein
MKAVGSIVKSTPHERYQSLAMFQVLDDGGSSSAASWSSDFVGVNRLALFSVEEKTKMNGEKESLEYLVNGNEPTLPEDVYRAFKENGINPKLLFILDANDRYVPYVTPGSSAAGESMVLYSFCRPPGSCAPGQTEYCWRRTNPDGTVDICCVCI